MRPEDRGPMVVAIVGGRLQGVEAAYLAGKAGWEVWVVDREPAVPARGLCRRYFRMDVAAEDGFPDRVLDGADLVIPALENDRALSSLVRQCEQRGVPLAFDSSAYGITVSKAASDRLFAAQGIPAPLPWTACGFPVMVKPDRASGSAGVTLLRDAGEVKARYPETFPPEGHVVQQYLDGPAYSLEVIGAAGECKSLVVTDLEMDPGYDCKRVTAPTALSETLCRRFESLGLQLARAIGLNGIMDVEVILHRGGLKVLEIDARLPSQTPMAVYHSTGINMVELLAEVFLEGVCTSSFDPKQSGGVVLEHIRVTPESIRTQGEHVMWVEEPLFLQTGFFGADEAITNYRPGRTHWVATLIFRAGNREAAWQKRCRALEALGRRLEIVNLLDETL